MSLKIVSLDLETTGTDIDAGAVPIQIGLAIRDVDPFDLTPRVWSFAEYINPRSADQNYTWSAGAEEVHGISRGDAEQQGEKTFVVAARAITWLDNYGFFDSARMDRWALGWNIGSFDMPFVRRFLPALGEQLSYRTLDLNAAVATIATQERGDFSEYKRKAKKYAAQTLEESGWGPNWHDAEYDALAALHSFEFISTSFPEEG